MVPFAERLERFVVTRWKHVVESGGAVFFHLYGGVIDHLIFVANGLRAVFGNKIFDTVVGFFGNPPIPFQVEVVEGILGDDIAAIHAGDLLENTILDDPTFVRKGGFLETAPTFSGLSVEKQSPARGLFFGREAIS